MQPARKVGRNLCAFKLHAKPSFADCINFACKLLMHSRTFLSERNIITFNNRHVNDLLKISRKSFIAFYNVNSDGLECKKDTNSE